MDDELFRLECLKMAQGEGLTGEEAMKRAQKIFEFARYGDDGATEMRRALSGTAPILENEHVRVVGKDGNLGRFTDYIRSKE